MKSLKKYFILHAPPKDVYNALTNRVMLEIWTGEPAQMSEEPGTEFSLWSGSITGRNLEFEAEKKIVQEWYFEGQKTKSIVTLKLHQHKGGTSVELDQTNIPDEAFKNISEGWDEDYFRALAELYK